MAVLVGSSGSGRVLRTAPALLLMWACLGLPSTAMAYPDYGNVGDFGARPYVCQTCHVELRSRVCGKPPTVPNPGPRIVSPETAPS